MRNKNIVFYAKLAKHYDFYSTRKAKYNDAVDKIIVDNAGSLIPESLLDIGCGNGKRSLSLANKLLIDDVVLLDSSLEMLSYFPKSSVNNHPIIVNDFIEDVNLNRKFSLILMLWNVLGHVDSEYRIKALKNVRELLDDNGELYLDINNRYNISAYKLPIVSKNILKDIFYPSSSNGDVDFVMDIGGEKIDGFGHVFNPREVERLINDAGLKIQKRFIVNYDSGKIEKNIFRGQLLYKITK